MKRGLRVFLITFLIISGFCIAASSANFPSKPINLVIEYKAGGGTDMIMRTIADAMARYGGWEIRATNMPGAVGSLATDFVYNKPSDGYWILGASNYNKALRVMGYHESIPWKDWQHYKMANSIQSFAVQPDSPIKTFKDLIELAKKKPEQFKISNSGIGGIWHEGVALVSNIAGVKFIDVPYDGGAPATVALLQNEVDVVASGLHEQVEYIKAGKIRPLAVMAPEAINIEGYGFVPSIKEYLPELESYLPHGATYSLVIKRDTPVEILEEFEKLFIEASKDKALQDLIKKRYFLLSVATGSKADKQAALAESITSHLYWDIGIGEVNPDELTIPRVTEFNNWWPPADYEPILK